MPSTMRRGWAFFLLAAGGLLSPPLSGARAAELTVDAPPSCVDPTTLAQEVGNLIGRPLAEIPDVDFRSGSPKPRRKDGGFTSRPRRQGSAARPPPCAAAGRSTARPAPSWPRRRRWPSPCRCGRWRRRTPRPPATRRETFSPSPPAALPAAAVVTTSPARPSWRPVGDTRTGDRHRRAPQHQPRRGAGRGSPARVATPRPTRHLVRLPGRDRLRRSRAARFSSRSAERSPAMRRGGGDGRRSPAAAPSSAVWRGPAWAWRGPRPATRSGEPPAPRRARPRRWAPTPRSCCAAGVAVPWPGPSSCSTAVQPVYRPSRAGGPSDRGVRAGVLRASFS